MARTVNEIYDSLIAEKNSQATLNALQPNIDSAQTLLTDLQSPSKVADWRLVLWVVAYACFVLETLWDLFKVELQQIVDEAIPGTARWYKDQSLKYQHGYQLVYINDKYQYSVDDPVARIVQRAAVVETGGQVRIKVAKLVGNTVTPLTVAELQAFEAYINQIKFAGTNSAVISRQPDLLKVAYTVYYDPLVLNANGSLITAPTVFPVEDAINSHIADLPFNGELVLTTLTDTAQKAAGVVNPMLTLAEAKYGALPYAPIVVKYVPDAGHMIVDPAFPLSVQITYVPNV